MSQASDPTTRAAQSERSRLQEARIMAALEAAAIAAGQTVTNQKSARALVHRQHGALEAVQDAGQKLGARGRDLRNSLQLLRESVDRAKLTALNAGLEGARLGEPIGKALVVMGDEVRNLLARALDGLEEHAALLAEVDRERDRYLSDLARVSDASSAVGGELARAEEKSQLTAAMLGEVRTELRELFGTDPETARILASSAGQVKTLASSLAELSERAPLDGKSLRELLAPLLALVAEDPERKR